MLSVRLDVKLLPSSLTVSVPTGLGVGLVVPQFTYHVTHLTKLLHVICFQNVSSTALIVIDELGRGTSSEEGVGLCCSVCEHLLRTKVMSMTSKGLLMSWAVAKVWN